MVNYFVIGAITTVISLTIKYVLLFTVLDANNAMQLQLSVGISWIFSVLFAYVSNRILVFKSKEKNILLEMLKFYGARIVTLLMEAGLMWLFITWLNMNGKTQIVIVTLLVQILVIVRNYVLSKIFVFKKKAE